MLDVRAWAASFDVNARPWLLLGKGPSLDRAAGVDRDRYFTFALNHVAREFPVTVAHAADIEVVRDCGDAIRANARWLLMPRHPHEGHRPSPRTLADFVAEIPVLADLDREGRLAWYNLSTSPPHGDSPVIRCDSFSAETALNLLVAAGAREVRTLGIDGGAAYSPRFDDLRGRTLLSNGLPSFDVQFQAIARTLRRSRVLFAPLGVEAPVRVFVGAADEERLATRVLEYSIRKHASLSVELAPIDVAPVPVPRDAGNQARTRFSFARFRIPELRGFAGRAVYLDSDMLVFRDIARLWTTPMDGAHALYAPAPPERGRPPQMSVMLLDCAALRWDVREIVRGLDEKRYAYHDLMRELCIVPRERVRMSLPAEWNSLEHYEHGRTCLLHYTDVPLQPWLAPGNPHAPLWYAALREALDEGFIAEPFVREEVARGHVHRDLPVWIGIDPAPPRGLVSRVAARLRRGRVGRWLVDESPIGAALRIALGRRKKTGPV